MPLRAPVSDARRGPPANIRRHLERIEEHAAIAAELAQRWNPKGRFYTVQREILKRCPGIEADARAMAAATRKERALHVPRNVKRLLSDMILGR